MLDPNKLFVVSAITRTNISEDLNGFLAGHGNETPLEATDPRLTDEVCAEYADQLGELRSQYEDTDCGAYIDAEAELQYETLKKIGVEFTLIE